MISFIERHNLIEPLLLDYQRVLDEVDKSLPEFEGDNLHRAVLPHVEKMWSYLKKGSRIQHCTKSSRQLDAIAKGYPEASPERYVVKALANICLIPHAPEVEKSARHYMGRTLQKLQEAGKGDSKP